jgi:hypothetical protein
MKAIICVLLLAGCASNTWTKPGASQEDFARDKWQCLSYAGVGAPPSQITYNPNAFAQGYNQGAALAAGARQNNIFRACMFDHGWRTQ